MTYSKVFWMSSYMWTHRIDLWSGDDNIILDYSTGTGAILSNKAKLDRVNI